MQNLTLKLFVHLLMNGKSGIIKKVNIEKIRKAIDQFPWVMRLTNIDVNLKVNLFKKTIKNIVRNYIPHDDKDPPSLQVISSK